MNDNVIVKSMTQVLSLSMTSERQECQDVKMYDYGLESIHHINIRTVNTTTLM